MNNFLKKWPAIFLLAALLLLPGCGQHFDCSGYIQGMLDATYKGMFEDYAEATNNTVEVIQEDYEAFIDHETKILLQFCGITSTDTLSDELYTKVRETVIAIFKASRYTIKEADKDGNVSITVEPLDIYNAVYDEFFAYNEEFKKRNNNFEFEDYTEAEFTQAYLGPLLDILSAHMAQMPYREAVTITITVAPDSEGYYTISDEAVGLIYNTIMHYTIEDSEHTS